MAQVEAGVALSVAVRWRPVGTAMNGTLVARPVRTTMLPPGGDASQLGRSVSRPSVTHRLVGKSLEGSRQVSVVDDVLTAARSLLGQVDSVTNSIAEL
jgi:hypothetical protein